MPRVARIVIPGCPHHVTQRGNNLQDVFFTDDDRLVYLRLLAAQSRRFGLAVEGYCLMTNHVHLVCTPEDEDSLALGVGRTNFLYCQYVNRLHGRSGHLWQNRFYSCALGERHFWLALMYSEQNPVRAKAARVPWRYKWSSAQAHCGDSDAPAFLDLSAWRHSFSPDEWRRMLAAGTDEDQIAPLRRHTHTGRPLGSDAFLSRMEVALGRRLRPLPRGRPRKAQFNAGANSRQRNK